MDLFPLVLDAQAHVWEASRQDRPWAPGLKPHLPEPFGGEALLRQMDEAGVDKAVLIPPMLARFSNDYALEVAATRPDRFKVIGRFDPRAPDALRRLTTWRDQPNMLGIRMVFQDGAQAFAIGDPNLDWFWPAAERAELPVMLRIVSDFDVLSQIARRHPRLPLVVDHLGLPNGTAPAVVSGLDKVLALANHANVFVKASAVPLYSAEPYPHRDLDPYLRRVLSAFGADRVMWGSDLTAQLKEGLSYRDCVRQFAEGTFLSAEEKEKVLGLTATRVLRW